MAKLKAICPNNPNHKRFETTAHVAQSWKVDEYGNFIEELETLETTHKPDKNNIWTCLECGSEAIVEEV